MRSAYATAHPAADPRPGPTRMPASLACLIRSQTMRKYELKPIEAIVSSSYWTRWRASSGALTPHRARTPSHVMWAR